MSKLKTLKESRAAVFAKIDELRTAADGREMTSEEQERWNTLLAEYEQADRAVEAEERYVDIERRQAEQQYVRQTSGEQTDERRAEEYRTAFRDYLLRGAADISPEHRTLFEQRAGITGFVGRRDRPFVAGRQHRGRTESLRRDVRGGFHSHHEQGRRPDYADGERYRCEGYGRCRIPAVDQVRAIVRLRNAQSLYLSHAHRPRVVGTAAGFGIRPRSAALGAVGRVVRAGYQLRSYTRRRQGQTQGHRRVGYGLGCSTGRCRHYVG